MKSLTISVKIPPVDERKITAAFKDYRARNIEESQRLLIDAVRQELDNRDMIVENDLYESWQALELVETEDSSKVVVGSEDIAAHVAEGGAVPATTGWVNTDEILNWIVKKGITPDYGSQEDFAFAIARAIGREGQPLQGGLKRPFNAAQKKAKRKIDRLWDDDIDRLIRDISNG
jgi:hypothetical protein